MNSYRFGPFTLESRLQRLVRDGQIVPLKPKAFDLLDVLLSHRDRVLGKDELLDWLWPRQDVPEANLTQTLYELRQALGDSAREARWIETVPRRGYRFVGEVRPFAAAGSAAVPRSIAVLPFRVLTRAEPLAELGVCLADAVILSLCSTGKLVVRPLSAVLQDFVQERDALWVGRTLEVDMVLEGTVQRVGETLRVNARLLRTNGEEDLWSDRYETSSADLLAVQDAIALQVAEAVALSLDGGERARMASSGATGQDVQALYLKARYCWQRWKPEASRQALEYLDAALALDPRHAPSHAWRAAAWLTLAIQGSVTPREGAQAARQAVQQAMALDPLLADAHEMNGALELFFHWKLEAAARSLDRAIELAPDSSNARHLRALTLAIGGHDAGAMAEMRRAVRADPSSLIANADLGMVHFWGRRPAEAVACFEATLELDPAFTHARLGLAHALVECGNYDRAVSEMERVVSDSGRQVPGEHAYVLGRAGDRQTASEMARRLQGKAKDGKADPHQVTMAWLGAGEHDRALAWLERAHDFGSRETVLLRVEPAMDPLRGRARFERIAALTLDDARQDS